MGAYFSRTNQNNRVITTRSQLDEEINLTFTNETPQTLSTSPIEQQHNQLISSFLEIAVGQTVETAKRFLETTDWNIVESINLFLHDNNYDPSMYNNDVAAQSYDETSDDETISGTSDDGESDSRLSSMYRHPVGSLYKDYSFEEAKLTSRRNNLWLLMNLQSRTEYDSHTPNRDLWSNKTVSEAVESSFVLWQVYDHTVEGQKISTFYKIDSAPPVVLVIDPVTGQKMRMWTGVIEAQSFVEDLSRFLESGPHEHLASLIRNRYPETKEEDIGSSSNYTDQVPAPSWGEEFEKEDNWSSSNNVVAPSWGEEFDEEDNWSSNNNVVAPSWSDESENVETWSASKNNDQIVASSWGAEFEESAEAEEEENGFPDMTEEPKDDCEFQESTETKEEEEEEKGTWLDFPDLTEEPKGDCSVVCSLCVRFPDGRRKQRKFLKSEPIQLLWSFCYSNMEESERKAFRLVQAIPGDSKTLDYGVNATFDESGLANSMVSLTWE